MELDWGSPCWLFACEFWGAVSVYTVAPENTLFKIFGSSYGHFAGGIARRPPVFAPLLRCNLVQYLASSEVIFSLEKCSFQVSNPTFFTFGRLQFLNFVILIVDDYITYGKGRPFGRFFNYRVALDAIWCNIWHLLKSYFLSRNAVSR